MTSPDFPIFDADNHYYEALDAFTRHLDPKLGPRAVQWVTVDGRRYHAVGGRIARVVKNPTFDPVALPGALCDFFRGNPEHKRPDEYLVAREPIRPAYRDRDARLASMDEHGLDKIWLFPTLGVCYEELLKHDVGAVAATFRSFNRWLQEDWGFAYHDRIYAAPYLSLADVDTAVMELEWALDCGARVLCLRPAPVTTAMGQRSPTDAMFDPFWARVNEAGITVVFHASDSGYRSNGYGSGPLTMTFDEDNVAAVAVEMFNLERAIADLLTVLIVDKLFLRFPRLRVASVENGSTFLPSLLSKLKGMEQRMPGHFPEDPIETFKRHVWINPFWEDDLSSVIEILGADRVLFGSDWPHVEGLRRPLDYLTEVKALDVAVQRRILNDNVNELTSCPT